MAHAPGMFKASLSLLCQGTYYLLAKQKQKQKTRLIHSPVFCS